MLYIYNQNKGQLDEKHPKDFIDNPLVFCFLDENTLITVITGDERVSSY